LAIFIPTEFCGAPPAIENAQSNLMRNQKHHVFRLGTDATYDCDQGFRPVFDTVHINSTRCQFAPQQLSPGASSNIIFPDSAIHESLRSGRAKNSKRLLEIDDEDVNHASNRVTSGSQFGDRHKTGRSENFIYDTANEPFLAGRNSDLENDPEVLEHRKQKLENSVRSGQRPEWYPAVTLKCERKFY